MIPLFNRGQSFLFLFILFCFSQFVNFILFLFYCFFCTSVIQILYLFGNLFVNKNFLI